MKRLLATALLLVAATPALAEAPHQVAVLRFLMREGEPEDRWLSTALADLLSRELSRREGVIVVERERVASLLRELDLQVKGIANAAGAGSFARVAAADRAVLGSFVFRDGRIEAEASLVAAPAGEVLTVARARGKVSTLGALALELADRLLGDRRPGPASPVAPALVESVAEFYRGIAAEERGDYPMAFLHLSRAARADRPHPESGGRLAGLYLRMGEPRHAVAAWRREAARSRGDRAVEAMLRAGSTLRRILGEPAAALQVYRQAAARWPDRTEVSEHLVRAALLMARGGDPDGALEALRERGAHLSGEIDRVKEESKGDRWIRRRLPLILEPYLGALVRIRGAAERIAVAELLAGRAPRSAPSNVVLLAEETTSLEFDTLLATQMDAIPPVFGELSAHSLVLVSPPGRAVQSARLTLRRRTPPADWRWPDGVSLLPWKRQEGPRRLLKTVREPREEVIELDLRPAATTAVLSVGGIGRHVERYSVEIRTAPAPAESGLRKPEGAWRIVGGIEGWAQHPGISRDLEGRIHVVFADGDLVPCGGRGTWAVRREGEPPSLWIASSAGDGRNFGPPRRLPVSSERDDIAPHLLHTRDGRHHLAWISNRSHPRIQRVWYSVSDDLSRWTFPRQVPVPFAPMSMPLGEQGMMSAAGSPQLAEGRDQRLHLLLEIPFGPEGQGIYRLGTTDGLRWGEATLVAPGDRGFSALALPDGALLVATRARGLPTELLRSREGTRWETLDASLPEGKIHRGSAVPPALALLPDGDLLILERFYTGETMLSGELALSRSSDGRSFSTRRAPIGEFHPRGLLPLTGGIAVTVHGPRPGMNDGALFLAPLEIPE